MDELRERIARAIIGAAGTNGPTAGSLLSAQRQADRVIKELELTEVYSHFRMSRNPNGKCQALFTCHCGESIAVSMAEGYDEDRNCTHPVFADPEGWYVDLDGVVRCPDHRTCFT